MRGKTILLLLVSLPNGIAFAPNMDRCYHVSVSQSAACSSRSKHSAASILSTITQKVSEFGFTRPTIPLRARETAQAMSPTDEIDPACPLVTREQLVKTFRKVLAQAGVQDCSNASALESSLSLEQITQVLLSLQYSKQEIECVFNQIDRNGEDH